MTTPATYLKKPDIVLREEKDDWALLFNPADGDVVGVNPVGVALWNLMDEHATVAAIAAALCRQCDAVPAEVEQDVAEYLGRLTARGFVTASGGTGA